MDAKTVKKKKNKQTNQTIQPTSQFQFSLGTLQALHKRPAELWVLMLWQGNPRKQSIHLSFMIRQQWNGPISFTCPLESNEEINNEILIKTLKHWILLQTSLDTPSHNNITKMKCSKWPNLYSYVTEQLLQVLLKQYFTTDTCSSRCKMFKIILHNLKKSKRDMFYI